jgi:hypothetical protein
VAKTHRDLDEALSQLREVKVSAQAAWDEAVGWFEEFDEMMIGQMSRREGEDPCSVTCLEGNWWGGVCFRCRRVIGLTLQEETAQAMCDEHAKRWHRFTEREWYCRSNPEWREYE